jgi:hypothetical protein
MNEIRKWMRLIENKIIAYHGTGSKFDEFSNGFVAGHFFTQNKDYALGYTGKTSKSLIDKPKKPRNYLLTVELTIDRMFDPASDAHALTLYNEQFIPTINAIHQKYHQPLLPTLPVGAMVSFIYADELYRYFARYPSDYDGMLVDEGGKFGTAIVPFQASQIKILKRQIIRD